jgi:hypothetical protein
MKRNHHPRRLLLLLLLLLLAAGLVACAPDVGPSASLVTGVRVLAVRGEPPEVAAGQSARFDVLVASPGGTLSPAAAWSMCVTPEPLGDNDVVSTACIRGDGTQPAGDAPSIEAAVPGDACSLFGPDPPPGGYRPRDADTTGGYYQPVRAAVSGADVAFGLERVTCNLANAAADVAHEYAMTYVPNRNPKLVPALAAKVDGTPVALDALPAGRRVILEAAWTADSAEPYVKFDPASQTLVGERESLRASWFSSDGTFDDTTTGRSSGDTATTSDDGWTAPTQLGPVHIWVVLRDSRGGLDFEAIDVQVVL